MTFQNKNDKLMNKTLYSDDYLITGIKKKDHEVIRYMYRNYYDSIKRLVCKNSGNDEDAEDVFQDSLMVVYKKIRDNNLKLSCSLKTFIYAISRNLWLQKLQKRKSNLVELYEVEDPEAHNVFDKDENFMEHGKFLLYQKHFLRLSEDCQKVLRLFLKKVSLTEIARIMNFSSVGYTKTRKYLCKKLLKERILNDPDCKQYNN